MRNPVRSEADAFHLVVAIGVVVVVSVALGALISPVVGVVLLAVALGAGMFWELRTKDPERRQPLREAHTHGRVNQPSGDGNRLLVVANRTLASDSLRSEIRRRAGDGAEIHVVAPILCSRLHYIATDVDRELRDARERLNDTLDALREEGVKVTGTVGDPNVALGAIEDELRRAGADEVLISTHPPKQSNWLETGIVARLRDELDIPVTHLVVETAALR
jgi:GABA permease